MAMYAEDGYFRDESGRVLLLRGCNLGGSSKIPAQPDGATWKKPHFLNHRQVSFVGRPFPLDQADEHFSRLRSWGFRFLRFLVTWEAVEHAGPGIYDQAYLRYLRDILIKAGEHGLKVFIDPHQDCWSRWTGGDGAPGWTLEALGIDLSQLGVTGAAISHQDHGDPLPRMIWPTNYSKYACALMFTAFFGGNAFLPQTKVEGLPVQDYLQGHYFQAMLRIAQMVQDLPQVVGFDSLNEPHSGFIGLKNLADLGGTFDLKLGQRPQPIQAMALASGNSQVIENWQFRFPFFLKTAPILVNPDGISLFRPGFGCPLAAHGVWTMAQGQAVVLRDDYFCRAAGRQVDFQEGHLKPFIKEFARVIRSCLPETMIFIESVPNSHHLEWTKADGANAAYAGHWYDGVTLITKHYNPYFSIDIAKRRPVFGSWAIERLFAATLGEIARVARETMADMPVLIGEFGLPFDMDNKKSYRTGDYSRQTQAMNAYYNGLDAHFLSATLWNYTADNTNDHGDNWNDEDLSVFSRDQQTDPMDQDSGGRALAGCVRPYALAIAGLPRRMTFNVARGIFRLVFIAGSSSRETEIFLAKLQFPQGFRVEHTAGSWQMDPGDQVLRFYYDLEPGSDCLITITRK